jgi:hypothetical protein
MTKTQLKLLQLAGLLFKLLIYWNLTEMMNFSFSSFVYGQADGLPIQVRVWWEDRLCSERRVQVRPTWDLPHKKSSRKCEARLHPQGI